ncbi:hypothetical protein SARC_04672 [Sphaeroforma arctica JP610]|uniref:Uncharacterized protein n=1 Tax=Sphaeroforma arctica JP610 TaxID=667725 RepID=A0A0L0G2J3_9EUKA|nr:hypothetical protein SARC_04672 [Sphaeroforma arctica JP610]KNC83054.1 hypothetical protein SARC_04672 [Sphaeroforma arctica JP610]|eukprot:XP_014156956.1 hypothetical protein SARC_04672 [Sphaeroforma arctica JP610]
MASWDPKMHIALYTTDRHGNAHRTLAQTSTHQHPHTQSRPQSVSQSQPPSPGKATTDAMGRRPSSLASGPAVSPAKATESDSRFGTPTPNQKRPIATSLSPRDNSAFLGLTATVAGVFRCAVQFTVLGRCGRSNADSTHDIDATSHAEDTSVNDYYVNAGRVCVTAVDEQVSVWHSSEHRVFRRMTDQANAAILYFTAHKPEAVLSSFLVWLHSYHNLFTAKCSRCDRHLCYDSEEFQYLPPVVRSFATENKKHIVYHRQCQYSSR